MRCIVVYAIVYGILDIFGCSLVNASWDLAVKALATTKCVDMPGFFLAASVAHVGMDFAVLLIPIHIVVSLQMPRREKQSLLVIFAAVTPKLS